MDNYILNYIKDNNFNEYVLLNLKDEEKINNYINTSINAILALYYNDIDQNLYESYKYYIEFYINNYVDNFIKLVNVSNKRKNILLNLKKLKLPEQRSVEWYSIRKKVLTASSLASVLGKCHFSSRESLILDKVSEKEKPFIPNPITEHGVKYEEIATQFYEKLYNVKIIEFGMVPHPTFPIFGASPDGICSENSSLEYIGRMLEIKCPPKRKFTKTVPINYLYQVQGQLECCDLDECDFFQVKICDYDSYEDYLNDKGDEIGLTKKGFPKGCVITYQKIFELKNSYMYPPSICREEEFYKNWNDEIKELIVEDKEKEYIETKWWYIERYECTLIKRDKNFWSDTIPHIIKFWDDVEKYKNLEDGENKLIKLINNKKTKKTNTFANMDVCMID
jgi:putative phage-type endonuclease